MKKSIVRRAKKKGSPLWNSTSCNWLIKNRIWKRGENSWNAEQEFSISCKTKNAFNNIPNVFPQNIKYCDDMTQIWRTAHQNTNKLYSKFRRKFALIIERLTNTDFYGQRYTAENSRFTTSDQNANNKYKLIQSRNLNRSNDQRGKVCLIRE